MESRRMDFPIFRNRDLVYLDSAATSQKPQKVIDAVRNFNARCNANPHRGTYSLSEEATGVLEGVREKTAAFLGTACAEEIIFTKNASEALNLLAYSYGLSRLPEGGEIVLSIMEHHSNLVPWQYVVQKKKGILKYIYLNDVFELDEREIMEKITEKTEIVAITHVSNVLGTVNPIQKIIEHAHEKGAVVVLDLTQSVAHMPIDVKDLDVDFAVFSAHKMYGPMGVGVLYGKKELLEAMDPFLMGGDMIEYVYEQSTTFAPLPHKFEAGTQNAESIAGLGAAIDYILEMGYPAIREIEKKLAEYTVSEMKKLPYVTVFRPDNACASSVISFGIRGIHPHDIASILDAEKICIRAGDHCAQPLIRSLGLDAVCRASFAIYNTKEDADALMAAIGKTYRMFEKYL